MLHKIIGGYVLGKGHIICEQHSFRPACPSIPQKKKFDVVQATSYRRYMLIGCFLPIWSTFSIMMFKADTRACLAFCVFANVKKYTFERSDLPTRLRTMRKSERENNQSVYPSILIRVFSFSRYYPQYTIP